MVKAGYKQTEVGIIPEDWDVYSLGQLGRFKNGINKDASSFGHGKPFVNLLDVFDSIVIEKSSELGLIDSTVLDRKEYDLKDGDVLFIRSSVKPSGVGLTVVIDSDLKDTTYSGFLIRYRTDLKFAKPYKKYCFSEAKFRNKVIAASSVSANTNINQDSLKNLFIALPPTKEEQTAIATVLSDVDALIASLNSKIAKKRDIKTATMQQLLTGKQRLAGFGEGKGMKPSELGEIPEDWEVLTVGKVSDLLTGFPFSSVNYSDNGVKLLRGSNIKRGVTDWADGITQYWPSITADIKKYELSEKDIVISMDGSLVGRSFAQLTKADLPAILLQRVARLRSEKVDIDFLKEWVCSKFFTEHCDSVKTTTAIPHISPADIRSFPIRVPVNKEEQAAIAGVLSAMDADIAALEQRLAKTKAMKQGMMQELLTGRTRLV
jgi:type I restriction enzyme S subunit